MTLLLNILGSEFSQYKTCLSDNKILRIDDNIKYKIFSDSSRVVLLKAVHANIKHSPVRTVKKVVL